ncbi:unnamed protein product [Cylindrotheca closterium]|uniref:Uncharacterized protein n=1 Tax=Cylindrotheca closterium TaxID=2856 RepID=A0AAD2FNT3_9STRA|nr:unnamed protein product [Cylindrotheca closterium]
MSYHVLSNDSTSVELMPFTALEEQQENNVAANNLEDYAYRQSSSIFFAGQWESYGSNLEETRLQFWSKWNDIQFAITRRWQLLSQRRQKRLHVAFVLLGVLVIVLSIEHGVKTLHEKHVKPPVSKDMMDDDDSEWVNDSNNNGNNAMSIILQDEQVYDIPVNRVLCEQEILPLFEILDESLDHLCFQRTEMKCSNGGGEDQTLFERDNVLYYPDGSLFDRSLLSWFDSCQPKATETWSPLSPTYSDFDKVCQEVVAMQNDGQDSITSTTPTSTTNNRFCSTTSSHDVDWSKVQETVPKCLMTIPHNCNNLNWKIFQEVIGGHLNCWEFQTAYLYLQHDYETMDDGDWHHHPRICKGGQ